MAPRMRRAYLKPYTQAKVNTGHNPYLMRELYKNKTLGQSVEFAIKLGLMPQDGGKTKADLMARAAQGEPLPEAIQQAMKLLQLEALRPFTNSIVIYKRKSEQLNMFHGAKGGRCMFVKVSAYGAIVQRSVEYQDRDRAIARYKNNKILWIETVNLTE